MFKLCLVGTTYHSRLAHLQLLLGDPVSFEERLSRLSALVGIQVHGEEILAKFLLLLKRDRVMRRNVGELD